MAPRWDCSVPGQLSTPPREVGCPLIFEVLSFKHECIFPYSEPCPFWRNRALQQQRQTWPGLPPDEPRLSRVPASREDLEQFLSRPFLVMCFSNSICSARPPAPAFSRMCAVCVWGGSPFGVQHPHGWKKQHPPSGGPHVPAHPVLRQLPVQGSCFLSARQEDTVTLRGAGEENASLQTSPYWTWQDSHFAGDDGRMGSWQPFRQAPPYLRENAPPMPPVQTASVSGTRTHCTGAVLNGLIAIL